jgi:hypothetical protein
MRKVRTRWYNHERSARLGFGFSRGISTSQKVQGQASIMTHSINRSKTKWRSRIENRTSNEAPVQNQSDIQSVHMMDFGYALSSHYNHAALDGIHEYSQQTEKGFCVPRENAVSYSNVTNSARRLFWAWIRKTPHHRPKMTASMKWTKQFCWLCPMNPFLM